MAREASALHKKRDTSVFLDTNVVFSYLKGDENAAHLFDSKLLQKHVRYAINPIVIQELFLTGDEHISSKLAEMISDKKIDLLAIDPGKTANLVRRIKKLRNWMTHSNNLLIYASASDCDFLVTEDKTFKAFENKRSPVILTTKEFLEHETETT